MKTEIDSDPSLATATLINGVVADLLYQSNFEYPDYPELVDLTVVGTGLGVLRSNLGFVNKTGVFWDSTQWRVPRSFLDGHGVAYANALAAWARDESAPPWSNDLISEVKRPMRSSLKFLLKTSDSFFQPAAAKSLLNQTQSDWWKSAETAATSAQVVAIRHLETDGRLTAQRDSLLLQKLQSNNRAIVLHAIDAVGRMESQNEAAIIELKSLVNDRDNEVRSKSLCVLTQLQKLDELTIDNAADMLDSSVRHNVFAGVYALSSLSEIPEYVLPPVDRAFKRALKACDYEFIGLFAAAYKHWLDEPQAYVQELLQDDRPEYLQIAIEALEDRPEEIVSLETS